MRRLIVSGGVFLVDALEGDDELGIAVGSIVYHELAIALELRILKSFGALALAKDRVRAAINIVGKEWWKASASH